MREGAAAVGVHDVPAFPTELAALQAVVDQTSPADVIGVMCHAEREDVDRWLRERGATVDGPGRAQAQGSRRSAAMTHPYWPLFDLRLRTADLELRPMTEADLTQLADELPDDLEQDPAATTYDVGSARERRGIVVHQSYWKHYGSWRPEAWRLNFVVRHEGQLIGVQELEGNDFLTLRTVDTSSYLVASARGRGLGKRMRAAVLALAFGPLEAEAAITSAWHDNHASLGVSRALGYQPNGESRMAREGGSGVDVLTHLLLKREAWLTSGLGDDVADRGLRALPATVRTAAWLTRSRAPRVAQCTAWSGPTRRSPAGLGLSVPIVQAPMAGGLHRPAARRCGVLSRGSRFRWPGRCSTPTLCATQSARSGH